MSALDALLVVLLAPFAFRGWVRGFCRESFGLAGVVGGVLAAAAGSAPLAGALVDRQLLSPVAALPAAFVGIFLGVVIAARIVGALADRVVRTVLLGGVNRAAGVGVGTLKGAAVLGFLLLLVERMVPSSGLAHAIGTSWLGQPLVAVANGVLDVGRELARGDARRHA